VEGARFTLNPSLRAGFRHMVEGESSIRKPPEAIILCLYYCKRFSIVIKCKVSEYINVKSDEIRNTFGSTHVVLMKGCSVFYKEALIICKTLADKTLFSYTEEYIYYFYS
jgi:hypothetical protein